MTTTTATNDGSNDDNDKNNSISSSSAYLIPLKIPCVYYDTQFIDPVKATQYYKELRSFIPWKKTSKINRWVYLCHAQANEDDDDNNNDQALTSSSYYSYRDNPDQQYQEQDQHEISNQGFPLIVEEIRKLCQEWYLQNHSPSDPKPPLFNICLLNFYENGEQRIGWHSDREEIGRTTPIASVSLGVTRKFCIRSQTNGYHDKYAIDCTNGSLIVMDNICQTEYVHSIPKETGVTEGRINLTFRCKSDADNIETTEGEKLHQRRDQFLQHITKTNDVEATANTVPWNIRTNDTDGLLTTPIFGQQQEEGEPSSKSSFDVSPSNIIFLVKTNLGAENYCAAEIREYINADTILASYNIHVVTRPFNILEGYIAVCMDNNDGKNNNNNDDDDHDDHDHDHDDDKSEIKTIMSTVQRILIKLQSAHHVVKYHYHFQLKDCRREEDREIVEEEKLPKEALYEHVKKQLVNKRFSITDPVSPPSSTTTAITTTFRVTCDRIGGPHAWQTPEVEYEIGGAIAEYMEPDGWKPKMEDYDVCIRADVIGKYVVIGTQLNVQDMSKGRHVYQFRNAVSIKSNLAYIMIRLANIKEYDMLVDPFCGSGTLLLEALSMFQGRVSCIGMDVSRRSAEGAKQNVAAEGYGNDSNCRFVCTDARGLRRHLDDNSVDAIISNLPWGVMTGQKQSISDLSTLYEVFLRTAWYVLKPGGRIVLLVLRGLLVMRIARKLSGRFRLIHGNIVRTTNNLPCLIVIEKLPTDEVRDAIKGQLTHLAQFVNVSPEIYQSIHTEDVDQEEK
jgi:tRNA G10  N-methylase Trm11/alkylated DNA repair dioxygenase AlkB